MERDWNNTLLEANAKVRTENITILLKKIHDVKIMLSDLEDQDLWNKKLSLTKDVKNKVLDIKETLIIIKGLEKGAFLDFDIALDKIDEALKDIDKKLK